MGRRVSGGGRPSGTPSRTSRGEAPRAPASDEGPESLRVRDLMVRSLVTVAHDAGLGTAENLMRTRRIRHLPVLDRARRLVGILTDRDLRRALLDPALHERSGQLSSTLERVKVRDVMTIGALAVRPEMDVREAARMMHERDIGALPVVADANRVVGMLTATDVMQYIVSGPARGRTRQVQRPRSR
jgi:acetoin utilization protein AcuB